MDTLFGELIFAANKRGANGSGGGGEEGRTREADYADLTYSAFRRDSTI